MILKDKEFYTMKARLPQSMGGGGAANLQQLARQAQKMQEKMPFVEYVNGQATCIAPDDPLNAARSPA